MAHTNNRFSSKLSALFGGRNRSSLSQVPAHLLTDCGFEGAANGRALNQEIDRLTLTLSSLR